MKVLITGAAGFIGRNLVEALAKKAQPEIFAFEKDTDPQRLNHFTQACQFVFHLAAVHRPADEREFETVNHIFFADLLAMLRENHNRSPVVLPSSIQAGHETAYGRSKLAAEKALKEHAALMNSRAVIYRLTNTFGRYARPNSHSVVATFCSNIARGLPIAISDPRRVMTFYYIDDVVASFLSQIDSCPEPDSDGFFRLPAELEYEITLVELADRIYYFKARLDHGLEPDLGDEFSKKLYETYLSYLS